MNPEVEDAIRKRRNQLANLDASSKRLDTLKKDIDEAISNMERANRYFKTGEYGLSINYEGKGSKDFKESTEESIEKIEATIKVFKDAKQVLDDEKANIKMKTNNLEHEINLLLGGEKL